MEDVLNVNYLKELKITFCLLFIPVLLRIIQVFSRETCTIYNHMCILKNIAFYSQFVVIVYIFYICILNCFISWNLTVTNFEPIYICSIFLVIKL